MEFILYIVLFLVVSEHTLLFIGLIKNLRQPRKSVYGENNLPCVSVVVAARNEEKVIESCIKSLIEISYRKDKLEIILVNDRSTDKTGDIMKRYSRDYVKYLEIIEAPTKLKGKTNALSQALKIAKGEIIFTTDADIEVQPTWINEMLKYYEEDTGVVASYSVMDAKGLNSGIQAFDWIYLLSIASGSFGLNSPISCVGNNMSYRKQAYDEVGGYENIKFSVTEDFMLLQTIRKKTKWKAKFPVNSNCLNKTLPCSWFMELYRQKKRWTKGGLDSQSGGIAAGVIAWLVSASIMFGWLFAGIKLYMLFLIVKILVDVLFNFPAINKFKVYKTYLYIIPFEIYYTIYVIIAPFIVLFDKKVVWKEQKL